MPSMWVRVQHYLGLGPDEDYDDYDELDSDVPPARPPRSYQPEPAETVGSVRTIPPRSVARNDRDTVAKEPPSRDQREAEPPAVTIRPRTSSAVRTVTASASGKPHPITPRSFNHAQEVADKFKEGHPVIVNLQHVERDLSRRLIDFASGLCYGLGGKMEKVANGVYLLTPANVEVSPEERRRITERGLDD